MVDIYVDEHKPFIPPHLRASRWAPPQVKMFVPGVPQHIPGTLTPKEFQALLIRVRIEEIGQKLSSPVIEVDQSHTRSPSPPPIYDRDGHRTNTREQRTRNGLQIERQELIHQCMRDLPNFKPPSDYRPVIIRKNRKLYIPIDKYPDYNFIGLIIGPRGMTQKQMEKETGAKIAIRGKGSVKDGKSNAGDSDRLHVLITAETDKSMEMATKMVQKLLIPVEEGQNEHKRMQLRKLAEINGTLRDNMYGRPRDLESNFDGPDVSCAFCGDMGHPARDCPVRAAGGQGKREDSEFQSFLAEIGEGDGRPIRKTTGSNQVPLDRSNSPEIIKAYEEFMAAIGEKPSDPSAAGAAPWEQEAQAPWLQEAANRGGGGGGGPAPWERQGGGGGGGGAAPWQQPQATDPLQKFMQSL